MTQELLKECLDVDVKSGLITYKIRPLKYCKTKRGQSAFNTSLAGKPAFTNVAYNGYLYGNLMNVRIPAHHIVWMYEYGYWPKEIDHINRVRSDNRLENLREVDRTFNNYNKVEQSNNTSGKRGVSLAPRSKGWRAYGNFKGKQYHLGCFKLKSDAIKARDAWEKSMGIV